DAGILRGHVVHVRDLVVEGAELLDREAFEAIGAFGTGGARSTRLGGRRRGGCLAHRLGRPAREERQEGGADEKREAGRAVVRDHSARQSGWLSMPATRLCPADPPLLSPVDGVAR